MRDFGYSIKKLTTVLTRPGNLDSYSRLAENGLDGLQRK